MNCEDCGNTEDLFKCERCEKIICSNCAASYDQFTEIDYNCCKACASQKDND